MKLTYIRLLVDNFDACFNFYAQTLGLEVTWGKPGDVYASFAAGSATALSIFSRPLMLDSLGRDTAVTTGSPQQVICFEADNVDAECARLQQAGVILINEPRDYPGWGCRCAHIADPDGNIIEINQELPQEKWSSELLENIPEKM